MANFLQIPILDAARQCSLTLKEGTLDNIEARAKCPFCDDVSHHLYMNTEDDLFYCQHCGAGGNSITLYARLRGVDNKTAYRELTQGNVLLLPARKAPPVEKQTAPLAARHDVYYDLLSRLTLSEAHRTNLRERGLPDARIAENRYRSMPSSYAERQDARHFWRQTKNDIHRPDGGRISRGVVGDPSPRTPPRQATAAAQGKNG